jgi:hypothetical protein
MSLVGPTHVLPNLISSSPDISSIDSDRRRAVEEGSELAKRRWWARRFASHPISLTSLSLAREHRWLVLFWSTPAHPRATAALLPPPRSCSPSSSPASHFGRSMPPHSRPPRAHRERVCRMDFVSRNCLFSANVRRLWQAQCTPCAYCEPLLRLTLVCSRASMILLISHLHLRYSFHAQENASKEA